jgi:D-alanyl-D-alanine dipeptidase
MDQADRERLQQQFSAANLPALTDELRAISRAARDASTLQERQDHVAALEARQRALLHDLMTAQREGLVRISELQPLMLRLRSQGEWGLD